MNEPTDNRDQKSGNGDQETDRMRLFLKSAMPRVDDDADLPRDLWPALLRRMEEQSASGVSSIPWFDWALAGGLMALAAVAPRTIPVILYYL